ncbi:MULTISPECIES: phage major capsid protein [Mycobacteriaceae]|uniref:Capsid protein n=1 Tax=Mycolicibacterium neoaurum VKM Ac-1815D TaxID=700508 RepID=V5XFL8_MYCNE|nr:MULTISPECIES: phage major capsid protein [Mycobacteriaceae]KUM06142.1 capsid protein [Mycolicibacterium neoaurum]
MTIRLETRPDALERQIADARKEARTLLDRAGGADLTGAEAERFDELTELIEAGNRQLEGIDRNFAAIRDAASDLRFFPGSTGGGDSTRDDGDQRGRAGGARLRHRDPWDTSHLTRMGVFGRDEESIGKELHERALDAVEDMPQATDKVREAATRFIERDDPDLGSPTAQLVLATTSPQYMRSFIKIIRAKGNMAALRAEDQEMLARAMSLVDLNGGFAVPFQLDPSVILTADGSVNQVREIARVVQATGDVWHGLSSTGVFGSWDGEGEEVSDDSPTLEQPAIPVHKYQAFVPLSHELQMDAPGLADDIARMLADDKDTKESIAHVTGTGVGQPTGIITALAGTASVRPAITADTLTAQDVYDLDSALPQRYAANGSWLAHRKTYNALRQFDQGGGNALWGQLADGRKSELLGRPNYIAEAMKSTIAAGQTNHMLVFGNFRNYVIADRLGATMSYIPHLFGPNGRPTGKSGWHAWFRSGADSVNDAAFRVLDC